MCRAALSILIVAAFFSTASAHPQTTDTPQAERSVIATTGEATIKVAPDRAWITISSESRARSPQEAQKLNAAAMSKVIQQLKAAGIEADAIRTTSIDLHPEFDYRDGKQTLRGYVARNTVEVRVDALSRLGEILDVAVEAGATSLGSIRFDVKNREAIERDALGRAVTDARQRAEALAAAAGVRIERIVRIEEHPVSTIPPPRPLSMGAQAERLAVETPVAPGEIEIKATVALTVAIR